MRAASHRWRMKLIVSTNSPIAGPETHTIHQMRVRAATAGSRLSAWNTTSVPWEIFGLERGPKIDGIDGRAPATRWARPGCHAGKTKLNTGNNAAEIIAAAHTICRSAAPRRRRIHVTSRPARRTADPLIIGL